MNGNGMTPDLVAFVRDQKDRHEIRECLMRYARGVDRHDFELMRSAYHDDAWDDHTVVSLGADEFCRHIIADSKARHVRHLHYIINHSVDLQGDVAHGETYYLYWGENQGAEPTLGFGRYIDRFEKRDGRWAIAYRRCLIETSGSYTARERPAIFDQTGPVRRDRDDISYARPLSRETPHD